MKDERLEGIWKGIETAVGPLHVDEAIDVLDRLAVRLDQFLADLQDETAWHDEPEIRE